MCLMSLFGLTSSEDGEKMINHKPAGTVKEAAKITMMGEELLLHKDMRILIIGNTFWT